jgi:PAS domain S-box-containing protein
MSYVTILWSMAAAAALTLGVVHALVWANDRQSRASLAFSFLALSVAAVATTELGMMYAQSPDEWGRWVRWCHLPLFVLIVGTFVFVRLYLNAGNWWLIVAIVTLRAVILVDNFTTYPNFNFDRIDSLGHETFLGEPVTVVGVAATGSWQWIATASGLLYLLFVIDAFVTVWRRGTTDDRRKALLIGGGILAFIAIAFASTQLVIWGVVRVPMLITPAFLVPLFAMAYELSRDALYASRLARELSESERRLDLAASSAGLGLCAFDGNGQAWATERARELFGLGRLEPIDLARLEATVHRDDIAAVRDTLNRALTSGGEWSVQFRVCTPDGADRWILARGRSDAASGGRPTALRGVLRDVTEQKNAEAEADELRRELVHVGRVTTLGQLTSSLAHELSQPLGAILRNAEAAEILLQRASPDLDELRAIVTDIHRDDRRAGEVIERLRALLQRRQLQFEAIAIDGLVRDVSAIVRSDATARHILIKCETEANLPKVCGDRVHLSQVLLNLLVNALDATHGTRQVLVQALAQTPRAVEVAVTDWGGGIPNDRLQRIFEPFYTTKAGGMGMGLAVSRTIVEAHGGRLWAENVADAGARFRLVLPVDEGLAA